MSTSKMNSNYETLAISYLTIRIVIGILGIAFPFILVIYSMVFGNCKVIQVSISSYYHTEARDIFVGVLCVFSVFLYAYKGYDQTDNIAANLASLFALGIAFFPSSVKSYLTECIPEVIDKKLTGTLHLIFAFFFFLILAYITFFLFTKGSEGPTKQKIKRNRWYRIAGATMLTSVILIILYIYVLQNRLNIQEYTPVFWLESIALWAFGISWLIKGQVLLKDVN